MNFRKSPLCNREKCNISQGVTVGSAKRGINKGPTILGDNIYISAGAKIIGATTVGNGVAIGANCVVTKTYQITLSLSVYPG